MSIFKKLCNERLLDTIILILCEYLQSTETLQLFTINIEREGTYKSY